jgi:Tfp pilus assembly protein PilX
MKKLKTNQEGFITMIVMLIGIVIAVIVLVYLRVKNAQ